MVMAVGRGGENGVKEDREEESTQDRSTPSPGDVGLLNVGLAAVAVATPVSFVFSAAVLVGFVEAEATDVAAQVGAAVATVSLGSASWGMAATATAVMLVVLAVVMAGIAAAQAADAAAEVADAVSARDCCRWV